MDAHKIFVSHSETDLKIAMQIVEFLESRGHRCWIDPRDVKEKSNWAEEADKAISECDSFVVICDARAGKSVRIPKEVGLASSEGKKIIQYRLEETEFAGALRYHLIDSIVIHAVEDTNVKLEHLIEAVTQVSEEVEGLKDNKKKKAKEQKRNWKNPGKSFIDQWKSKLHSDIEKIQKSRKMLGIFAGVLALTIGVLAVAFIVFQKVEKKLSYDYMTVYFYRDAQEDTTAKTEKQDRQTALKERWNSYYRDQKYRLQESDQVLMAKIPSDKVPLGSIDEALDQIAGEDYNFYRTVPVVWKNVKEDQFRGTYQCNVKELKGQLYDAVYNCYEIKYEDGNVSDGIWYDTNKQLRSRLDMLEIPYAIGCLGDREQTIVVRIGMETINSAMLSLLTGEPYIHIKAESGKRYNGVGKFQYGAKEDGNLWASMELKNDNDELLEGKGTGAVFLNDDGTVCVLQGIQEGKIVLFDSSPYAEDGSIPSKAEPLLKLIQKSCEDDFISEYFYDSSGSSVAVFSRDDFQCLLDGQFRFGLQYLRYQVEGDDLEGRLKRQISDDIIVKLDKHGNCHIYDYLALDDTFPKDALEHTINILEATEEDNLNGIFIHFTKEQGDERARAVYANVEEEGFGVKGTLDFFFFGKNVEIYQTEIEKLADENAYIRDNQLISNEEYGERQMAYYDEWISSVDN